MVIRGHRLKSTPSIPRQTRPKPARLSWSGGDPFGEGFVIQFCFEPSRLCRDGDDNAAFEALLLGASTKVPARHGEPMEAGGDA